MGKKRSAAPLHPSIRTALGVSDDISDSELLSKLKKRTREICKPCWELKYCPYGPLVEDSPLLPTLRDEAVAHNEYLKNCLATGMVGETKPLSDEDRAVYEGCVAAFDPEDYEPDPGGEFGAMSALQSAGHMKEGVELTREVAVRVNEDMKRSLETGLDGKSEPLSDARREMFEGMAGKFDPENHPVSIPKVLTDLECTVFGHICPVFANAEILTETSTLRRSGRYISFQTKMRVVRRDNYTCQHCGKHLQDDEVEFDHIIPHSKGGSVEEHNIRLTCFDCNRGKSDEVRI